MSQLFRKQQFWQQSTRAGGYRFNFLEELCVILWNAWDFLKFFSLEIQWN